MAKPSDSAYTDSYPDVHISQHLKKTGEKKGKEVLHKFLCTYYTNYTNFCVRIT